MKNDCGLACRWRPRRGGSRLRHDERPGRAQRSAVAMMKASFKEHGQAKLDRLDQDDMQRHVQPVSPGKRHAEGCRREARAGRSWRRSSIRPTASYLGDWKAGERIAQTGVGMQYNDDPATPDGRQLLRVPPAHEGGGLVRHHRPAASTTSRKTRGFTPEMQKYAYGKVYNSQAFAACSNMPRFGHSGILTEQQIKDVVALLMDPESPVNK